jgi:hypothetical protein
MLSPSQQKLSTLSVFKQIALSPTHVSKIHASEACKQKRVHPDIRTIKRVVENSNSEFSHGICLKLLIEAASY